MQYVRVSYPDKRTVYVDGRSAGMTDEILLIPEGWHIFEVEGVTGSQQVKVENTTSPLTPLVIKFGDLEIAGDDANQVSKTALKLLEVKGKSMEATEHVRLVRIMLIGVFMTSIIFAIVGVVLVYLGATEQMEIEIFGQKMSSTGPGIAAMFLGAVLIGTTGRQLFRYLRSD